MLNEYDLALSLIWSRKSGVRRYSWINLVEFILCLYVPSILDGVLRYPRNAGWRVHGPTVRCATSLGCANRVVANEHTIRFFQFWDCGGASRGAKFPRM